MIVFCSTPSSRMKCALNIARKTPRENHFSLLAKPNYGLLVNLEETYTQSLDKWWHGPRDRNKRISKAFSLAILASRLCSIIFGSFAPRINIEYIYNTHRLGHFCCSQRKWCNIISLSGFGAHKQPKLVWCTIFAYTFHN